MKTLNDLPSNSRSAAAERLNAHLAGALDLALCVKQAHWNIRGAGFIALHEMLDGLRASLDGEIDTLAERIAQLGFPAHGTLQAIQQATSFDPYPLEEVEIGKHLAALAQRYAALGGAVRRDIATLDEMGDPASADILTGTARVLDKGLWFLEAHLSPA